jgi:dipeptidyl aminopeptidase/acylaminoacyl peptidase
MNLRALAGAAFAASLSIVIPNTALADPAPLEAFAALPQLAGPQLSPDGRHFAVIQPHAGRPAVLVYSVGASTPPAVCDAPDGIVDYVLWGNDNRLLITVSINTRNNVASKLYTFRRVIAVDANCANAVVLFADAPNSNLFLDGPQLLDRDLADPGFAFMAMMGDTRVRDNRHRASATASQAMVAGGNLYLNVYRVNLANGDYELVEPGSVYTTEWYMDGHGKIVARVDQYKNDLKLHVKVLHDGTWLDLAVFDASRGREADVQGLSLDGSSLVIRTRSENRTQALYPLDMSTGKLGPALLKNPDYDVDYAIADAYSHRIVGGAYVTDKTEYVYFDPDRQKLQQVLEKSFPASEVTLSSSDRGGAAYIVSVSDAQAPAGYYYFERGTMRAAAVGSSRPNLAGQPMGTMKPYQYTARDGTVIHGYLTTPSGREARNLPAVVMPHGGPEARDQLGFDWWAQFLVSRGYAVFQPNYRGSTGYGGKFMEAGRGGWGLVMQDDVTDGVKKLVVDGVIDPRRVCIVGASYGGYAALAGAAFTPDLYACAVAVAPVSDLGRFLDRVRRDYGDISEVTAVWQDRFGNDRKKMDAASPALHADAVRIPVLLMHGRDDTTVPIEQSLAMESALKSAGKTVQFVRLDGDDHYLNFAATRLQVLTEIDRFLARYLGH